MSVNLSIKGVSTDVAARLRARAARNHRSLQGELMAIVARAAAESTGAAAPRALGDATVAQGWKTIADLVAERRVRPQPVGNRADNNLPLAVDIIRADRDSR